MKVIFLDIDGVLNSFASIAENVHLVSDKCLHMRRIIKATGAKVVVSSTWRIGETAKSLDNMLWRSGMPYQYVIDCTPQLEGIRGNEIDAWLSRHPEVTNYCIIDDDSDFHPHQKRFFFQTDMRFGLIERHCKHIIRILNSNDTTILVTDLVRKANNTEFENGDLLARVKSIGDIMVSKDYWVDGAYLVDCDQPIALDKLVRVGN